MGNFIIFFCQLVLSGECLPLYNFSKQLMACQPKTILQGTCTVYGEKRYERS